MDLKTFSLTYLSRSKFQKHGNMTDMKCEYFLPVRADTFYEGHCMHIAHCTLCTRRLINFYERCLTSGLQKYHLEESLFVLIVRSKKC